MLSPDEKRWLEVMTSTGTLLPAEELHSLVEEALTRWEQFQGHRPLTWPSVLGWTRIAGEYEIPPDAALILESCPPERRHEVARAYLAWNRHDSTRAHPNPYEPLLTFFHHGGTWTRPENGILDIFDAMGGRCGIITRKTT